MTDKPQSFHERADDALGRLTYALESIFDQFTDDGKARGDGMWRQTAIFKAAKAIDEAVSDLGQVEVERKKAGRDGKQRTRLDQDFGRVSDSA